MTDDIYETPSSTPNFRTQLAAQLSDLAPESISDGKIDIEVLRELLETDATETNERFGLFWPGRKRALRAAQSMTTATLRPIVEQSKDWDSTKNVVIEGDNLEVLKILQKHYHAQVKVIYIDPPYNTGKDFVYPDNFKEGVESYLEWSRQVNEDGKKLSTNTDSEGRYHSNWLNMMYPRLKLARNLLKQDGVIFLSIDDNEYDNLKKLCDLVFGESNYLNTFVWVSNLKGRQISANGAAGTKEYILAYGRRADETSEFRASGTRLKAVMPTVYKGFNYTAQTDEYGPYVIKNELYNSNSAFNEVTRPNLVFDIYFNPATSEVKTTAVSDDHKFADYAKISPKRNNNGTNKYHAFRWSTKKVEAESHNLSFVETSTGWKVFTKVRDIDSTSLKDLIMDITTNEGSADIEKLGLDPSWFDYPKPVNLVKLLIEAASDKDSIVLDFFAGSGTTAHAVMQRNSEDGGSRRFISVQLPEPLVEDHPARTKEMKSISDISIARIRAASAHFESKADGLITDGENADFGFRAYKLADSCFAKWHMSSDTDVTKLEQRLFELRGSSLDGSTQDDLLTEILLKQGHSLSEVQSKIDVGSLTLKSVGDGLLLAYLAEDIKPTLEDLRLVLELQPAKLVVLDDAFQGDDELKTNLVQLCKSRGTELWSA